MLIKRLILAVISIAVGFGLTYFIVRAEFIADTSLKEYGFWYTFFTTLSLACFVGIWLDKFMDTKILPE